MLNSIIIGNKIIEARKNKNLSQAALANHLSVSSQAVGKWERGESMPDIITFERMAQVLEIDLNYFSEQFESKPNEVTSDPSDDLQKEHQPKKWNMSAGNWSDADFSGIKNLNGKFNRSNIQNCLFTGSDLSEMIMKGNNIIACNFSESDLNSSNFSGSNIKKNDFKSCSLKNSIFSGSNIDHSDFTDVDFTGTNFKGSAFIKNIITNAVWNSTEFHRSGLTEVTFEGDITDCSFENCSYSKVEFRNVTFKNTFFKAGNIKKIKFTNCKADNLTYAFLKSGKADLTNINADLKNVELIEKEEN